MFTRLRRDPIPQALSLGFLLLLGGSAVQAHEIPNDVTVQAFMKPEGQRLRLLMRVPLRSMRDIEFPQRNNGYMDFDRVEPLLPDAATLWISSALAIYEEETQLARPEVSLTRISLESDKSFASYEEAMAHMNGPKLPRDTNVVWNQTFMDVLLVYNIRSQDSRFSLQSDLARLGLRTITVLRYILPSGAVRAFEFVDDPGLVRLDPRWLQAALNFVNLGFKHILDGTDHLLFLLCLVIPFRRLRPLIVIVTAFTVAHSITLIASAYGMAPGALWFPPLIETLIATSIVYMALENIVRAAPGASELSGELSGGRNARLERWMIAFAFGLVHGFGFSFALRQTLQFAGSHMLTSLLAFNVGVELGQVLVLSLCVPLLGLLFRYGMPERIGTIVLSTLITHTGWHWMIERASQFSQYTITWPEWNAAFLASAARWLMAIVVVSGIVWFFRNVLRGGPQGRPSGESAAKE